jgi:hypothetical protein
MNFKSLCMTGDLKNLEDFLKNPKDPKFEQIDYNKKQAIYYAACGCLIQEGSHVLFMEGPRIGSSYDILQFILETQDWTTSDTLMLRDIARGHNNESLLLFLTRNNKEE